MLAITSLQNNWVKKQIDFSNDLVQAPINHDIYIGLPPLFSDESGIDTRKLCLKLNKSLYGLCDAPKLWSDYLEGALAHCGFTVSVEDPGIYYGQGIATAVYVDDVLFFGPDTDAIEKVITELQTCGFDLKQEKYAEETTYNFLGINLSEENGFIKLTQHGLIKKFLNCVDMLDCNAKETPCSTSPLGTNTNGPK